MSGTRAKSEQPLRGHSRESRNKVFARSPASEASGGGQLFFTAVGVSGVGRDRRRQTDESFCRAQRGQTGWPTALLGGRRRPRHADAGHVCGGRGRGHWQRAGGARLGVDGPRAQGGRQADADVDAAAGVLPAVQRRYLGVGLCYSAGKASSEAWKNYDDVKMLFWRCRVRPERTVGWRRGGVGIWDFHLWLPWRSCLRKSSCLGGFSLFT